MRQGRGPSISIRSAWCSFHAAIRPRHPSSTWGIGRTTAGRSLLGSVAALILHFAAIKAHCRNRGLSTRQVNCGYALADAELWQRPHAGRLPLHFSNRPSKSLGDWIPSPIAHFSSQ